MLHEILIFTGLSLDAFIVMMNKGAQLRNLKFKKLILYALEFAVVATAMFMLGFGISKLIALPIVKAKVEITIASCILFFVGVFTITKSFMQKGFVEKLDDGFDYRALLRMALYTSIDTFFVGVAYGLLAIDTTHAVGISFLITLLAVLSALLIGYNLGAKYQKVVGMVGGALMVFFGIYLIAVYLVMR